MFTSFSTALSGLNAMTTGIDVVGNNLANLDTTGYKDNRVSFQDLVAESLNGNDNMQVGLGTSRPLTDRVFSQGAVTATAGSYDAAINGNGFFVVKDANQQTLFTRAGDFKVDKSGYLTTQTGERLQGYTANNGVVTAGGSLSDIQIPVGQTLPPKATTQFSITANLNAASPGGTTFSAPMQMVDSLGNTVPVDIAFTRDTVTAGQWNYNITGPTGTTVTGGTGSFQFDASGNLTSPSQANGNLTVGVSGMSDGAAPLSMTWNLYDTIGKATVTQFAQASTTTANPQNGQAAAQLTGVALGNDGLITTQYSNGVKVITGQLALAGIRNPESLIDVGNNNFGLGANTATPAVGASGTGGRGNIEGGALEGSTVDIASEFSNLLTYQRSYQANSRVITVSDSLSQEAVNLVHS